MNITIPRQDLLDTVNKVKTVVSAKSALPILSHILFEASDNRLKLSATDLKVSIECEVDCDVSEEGAMTVSSQRLASILAELPDADISLQTQEHNVVELRCGRIHTKLFSMAPDEFPPVRSFDGVPAMRFTQKLLKDLFQKTSFAICTDQARYNLTGLLFEISGGKLTVVATDGRRMSLNLQEDGVPEDADIKVIIPSKMIHELERLLGEEDPVEVAIDESQAAFKFNNLRLVSALIEGNFPNYEMVVPKKHDKEAVLDRLAFTEAMRRCRTMTNEKFNSVRFAVDEQGITLRVVTPEVGEYEEHVDAKYSEERVEIAFNPEFIIDVLRHIDTDDVVLVLKDAMSPGLVKPFTDGAPDNYLNVVMPIRI